MPHDFTYMWNLKNKIHEHIEQKQTCKYREHIYLFVLREGKEGRKGEKHQCVVASCAPPTGDLVCNPGMCPDWESNQRPIGTQST